MTKTDYWVFDEKHFVLYSEEPFVWEAAKATGLLPTGNYFNKNGDLLARQFLVEVDKMAALVEAVIKKTG